MKELRISIESSLSVASLGLMVYALFGGFSLDTRNRIRDRAVKKFGRLCSEWSGRDDEPLQAAHWDHSKNSPRYDDPQNGRLLTLTEHLEDHIRRAGRNGLSKRDNDAAIASLKSQIKKFEKQRSQERRFGRRAG